MKYIVKCIARMYLVVKSMTEIVNVSDLLKTLYCIFKYITHYSVLLINRSRMQHTCHENGTLISNIINVTHTELIGFKCSRTPVKAILSFMLFALFNQLVTRRYISISLILLQWCAHYQYMYDYFVVFACGVNTLDKLIDLLFIMY